MRLIDADALMDDIRRDSKKAIDEGDKVGSFWFGYAAGLVIKQPTIQPVATDTNVGNNSEIPNGSDIISRQAAIDAIEKNACNTQRIMDAVNNLPPAQPEPQWGRFERKRDGVFCSVCHNGWEFITGVPVEVEREYRYCPYCGAKMEGKIT